MPVFGTTQPTPVSDTKPASKPYPKAKAKKWFLDLLSLPSKLYVRYRHNIQQVNITGHEKIQEALDRGDHVELCFNHPGHGDTLMTHPLYRAVGRKPFNIIVADFFFNNHFISEKWRHRLLNWRGMFPLNREILDKAAIGAAIETVTEGKNPFVIFPEGISTGQNDNLGEIKEGFGMIGLSSAKKIAKPKPDSSVLAFPVAMRHHFTTDIRGNLSKHLTRLEKQLDLPLGDVKDLNEETLLKRTEALGRAVIVSREKVMLGRNTDVSGKTWEEMHQAIMAGIAAQVASEVGLSLKPDSSILDKHRDIIGKLKLLARDAEQKQDKAEIRRVRTLNTKMTPILDNLYEMLKLSPNYTQAVVNQHRLAEGLYRIDAVMNDNTSKVIINCGPRVTCMEVGDPINLSELLKSHIGSRKSRRKLAAKILETRLQTMLANGNPKP